jgi:hypothetical protein
MSRAGGPQRIRLTLCSRRVRAGVELHCLPPPGCRWISRLRQPVRALRGGGGEILHMTLPSRYDARVSSVAWAARQAGYRRVVSTEHLPMNYPIQKQGIPADKIRVVPNGVEEPGTLRAA